MLFFASSDSYNFNTLLLSPIFQFGISTSENRNTLMATLMNFQFENIFSQRLL